MDLEGKYVVVTGASQGIGAQLARDFSAHGATVLLVARSEDKLARLAEEVGGKYVVADLADADATESLVRRCLEEIPSIDVWVNNAGVETSEAFVDVERDTIRQLARLNFEAPLVLTHAVLEHMVARGSGHIVQMSSVAGAIPFPGLAAYSGSKAGLTNFTETLRIELKGRDVGLTVVSPGPVQTDMWDRIELDGSYAMPALKRFKLLGFLPHLDVETISSATVAAVLNDRPFVRLPRRYNGYHWLNNLPRRLVDVALTGVKLPSQR